MEYLLKIKEACKNHQIPDIVWVESVMELLGEKENNHTKAMLKYSKSEKGVKARKLAQASFRARKKLKKENIPIYLNDGISVNL